MAFTLLNGRSCTSVRLSLPRMGAWHADCALEGAETLSGPAVLQLDNGRVTLVGTIQRTGESAGAGLVHVVGGKAGLSKPVPPRFFRGAPLRTVVAYILGQVGEQLAPSSDADELARTLEVWTLAACSAGVALRTVVAPLAWRVLASGAVWVGKEAWPSAQLPEGAVLVEDPLQRRFFLDGDSPTLLPGTVLNGRQVSYVEHRFEGDSLRSMAWWEEAS